MGQIKVKVSSVRSCLPTNISVSMSVVFLGEDEGENIFTLFLLKAEGSKMSRFI